MNQPLEILAFFAHPDDETMLCGGTLTLLAQQGARVHIMIATRGEGGEMGEPPLCERDELGKMREEELRCAVQALGAQSLILLDYMDPIIGPEDVLFPYTEDVDALSDELVKTIRQLKIGALLCHGVNGEYGHPAHMLSYQAAIQAVEKLGKDAPLFYSVQGTFEGHPHPRLANVDSPAHLVIDVTSVLEQKTAAALCHSTQHALFVRRSSEEAGRQLTVPEVIQSLESLHRVLPPVAAQEEIHDALADLLWASGFARLPALP